MPEVDALSVKLGIDASELHRGLQSAGTALQGLSRSVVAVGGRPIRVDVDTRGLQQAAVASRQLAQSVEGVGKAGASLSGLTFGFAAGAGIAAFNLALRGIQTAMGAVQQATVGFNASLEQAGVAFTALLGNGERAQAFLLDLQKLAIATPFEFKDMVTGARNLLGMGFAARDVKGILTDLSNVAATLGLSSSDVQRFAVVLGQMRGAGRVLGQDLLQLSSAGIDVGQVFAIMAEQTGKTVPELKAMQEAGTLSSEAFIRAFRAFAQQPQFANGAANQAKTFTGAMNSIRESLTLLTSTAFKPLFDRLSQLAQNIAAFVQSDQFTVWSARVAAAVDVALDAIGTLAGAFGSALGAVFQVVLGWGQAIYEALSWINPWAKHSPSLVDQVGSGVAAIVRGYEGLRGIAGPVTQAQNAIQALNASLSGADLAKGLKDAADAAKDNVDRISAALNDAKADLQRFVSAPVEGSKAFADRIFGTSQEIAQRQLTINRLQLARANRQPTTAEDRRAAIQASRDIPRLRLEEENARLEEQVTLGPQRKAIDDLTKPAELPFGVIVAGIKNAQGAIKTLEPALKGAQAYWDQLRDAADKAGKAVAGALATPTGDKLGGVDEALAEAKAKLDEWKKSMDGFRAEFANSPILGFIRDLTRAFRDFANFLVGPQAVDNSVSAFSELEGALAQGKGEAGGFLKSIQAFGTALGTSLKGPAEAVAAVVERIAEAVKGTIIWARETGAIDSLARSFGNLFDATSKIAPILADIAKALAGIAQNSPAAAAGWKLVGDAILRWVENIERLSEAVKGATDLLTAIRLAVRGFGVAQGWRPSLFDDDEPGALTPPGRAAGGPVKAGQLYRVNELGREYFRPAMDGVVIPAGRLSPDVVGAHEQIAAYATHAAIDVPTGGAPDQRQFHFDFRGSTFRNEADIRRVEQAAQSGVSKASLIASQRAAVWPADRTEAGAR